MLLNNLFKNSKFIFNFNTYRCCGNFAYVHQPGNEPLVYRNIGQKIERAVEKFGSQIAIKSRYEQKELSFEESYKEAVNLAVKLHEIGLKEGDHVAIWAPNTIQWYLTFLASAIGGFPLVCINPALQVPELEYALKKAKVKSLITMDCYDKLEFLNKVKQLNTAESTVQSPLSIIIKCDKNVKDFLNYDELLDKKSDRQNIDKIKSNMQEINPETPSVIQFTSGTTGQPKAALLSHFNIVNQAVYMGRGLRLHPGGKTLCLTVPMFHAFGLSILVACLHYGSTLSLPSPTFNAVAALEAIERDKCNVVVGTPTMFVDMLDQQSRLQKNVESLEAALVGGSACSPEVAKQTKKVLGLREMVIGYGLSEGTAAVFVQDGTESSESALHSVGKIFSHCEAKIIDEKGNILKFGEVGELCVRGWVTMMGYFEDVENTQRTKDVYGWLRTGDQFLLEPNGVARYQGRKKDVIVRGGENVFPKEIEDFLNQHESVLESHVIGVPDHRLGEEICVYMRLKQGAKPLAVEDIIKFCKGKLAYFKVPKYVRIVDDFPKTTSGKIQKFKLQELFVNEK
ncbi:medium-chain acyl-CoA ligase ACSF2, mitochondrial-like [Cochliomyia hominivorax]